MAGNPPATLGTAISDTATIAGLVNPVVATAPGQGTITFRAYGPDDATCTVLAHTSPAQLVPGNGSVSSAPPPFVPTAPGTYRWIASYSGDANNVPLATACADPLESSVVTRADARRSSPRPATTRRPPPPRSAPPSATPPPSAAW